MAKDPEDNEFFPFISVEERDDFAKVVFSHGIRKVVIEFSGSGDSGAIDAVVFYDGDDKRIVNAGQIPGPAYTESYQEYDPESRKYVYRTRKVEANALSEVVSAVVYSLLESTNLNWFNNEGGQGSISLEFDNDGKLVFVGEVGVNHMETEDHSFEWRPYKE